MRRHLDDFHELPVRCGAAEDEARFFELFAILVVEFVAMTMPFMDDESAVNLRCLGIRPELARPAIRAAWCRLSS